MRVARGRGPLAVVQHLAGDRQAHPARHSDAREGVLQIVQPHIPSPAAARIACHGFSS
jgi:hypothetical protein